MKKVIPVLALACGISLFKVPTAVGAPAIVYVDDDDPLCGNNSPCYSSITQAGYDVADEGTVLVRPGVYNQNVGIGYKNIVLKSEAGPNSTIIDGGGAASALYLFESHSVVEGFTFRNGGGLLNLTENGYGVALLGSNRVYGTVRGNIFVGNARAGVGFRTSGGGELVVTIENNLIYNNAGQGVALDASGFDGNGSIRVNNNIIAGNRQRAHVWRRLCTFTAAANSSEPGGPSVEIVNNDADYQANLRGAASEALGIFTSTASRRHLDSGATVHCDL